MYVHSYTYNIYTYIYVHMCVYTYMHTCTPNHSNIQENIKYILAFIQTIYAHKSYMCMCMLAYMHTHMRVYTFLRDLLRPDYSVGIRSCLLAQDSTTGRLASQSAPLRSLAVNRH